MSNETESGLAPLTTPSSWERWVDLALIWLPYATLAAAFVVSQVGVKSTSDRLWSLGLTLAAAVWTWATFSSRGRPTQLSQGALRTYFVGFVVLSAALTLHEPVFLAYGITGFFHASLLRPWVLSFIGIGASAMVVQSTIVYPGGTTLDWLIYAGVVVFQSAAVGIGIYAGVRVMETAEQRRDTLERLEAAIEENAGLHEQLVAQAREAGVLDERQRIAREIHDTIAQGLTGVVTQLEAASYSWPDDAEVRRRIDNASQLARESLDEARRSVHAIRPIELEEARLPEALAQVTERWVERNGIEARFSVIGERRALLPEVEVTMLRVTQEALSNVAKHSSASRAGVTLTYLYDSVALDVRDDGIGFDPRSEPASDAFGLSSMHQRVNHIDGLLAVESTPGQGTAVSARVPTATTEDGNG